jgi:hypothetical protein
MTITTTITFKRDGDTLAVQTRTFRGRWVGNAERKAMNWAIDHPLFRCCDGIRIFCETGAGQSSSLYWVLHPDLPAPKKLSEIPA